MPVDVRARIWPRQGRRAFLGPEGASPPSFAAGIKETKKRGMPQTITAGTFLVNLLIAQLNCAYQATYEDAASQERERERDASANDPADCRGWCGSAAGRTETETGTVNA